jgi:hypothetical protein
MGTDGGVAGEFDVPAGTYLVQGYMCWYENLTTQWAWVQVGDGETVSVNLVTTPVNECVNNAMVGVTQGRVTNNVGELIRVREIRDGGPIVDNFVKSARALLAILPKQPGFPMPDPDELVKRLMQPPVK